MHSLTSSAASVTDKHMLAGLLHGEERKVWGDAGISRPDAAIRAAAPKAQDMTSRRMKNKTDVDEEPRRKNRTKARVRARVEHPFRILKRVFGFTGCATEAYGKTTSGCARPPAGYTNCRTYGKCADFMPFWKNTGGRLL